MASNTLTLEVSADDCTFPPPSKPERIPKRVLHFSDGTLEEYSTDEDDAVESEVVQQNVSQLESIDPKTLTWIPWFWYQTAVAGSKTLEVCDYLGESLASFFGITTPKYQFEIDHYQQMMAEEEELKKQQDLEMGGWVAKNSETGEGEKSKNITEAPSLQRY